MGEFEILGHRCQDSKSRAVTMNYLRKKGEIEPVEYHMSIDEAFAKAGVDENAEILYGVRKEI